MAEYSNTLRDEAVRVLHDVVGEGFDVNHVVVWPRRVSVLETKAISTQVDHDVRVVFDGERVCLGGYVPTCDPVVQVQAAAAGVWRTLDTKAAYGVWFDLRLSAR